MISPRFVSDSSSDGWMTTWSSSGSSVRSTWRKLQPAGFDDPLKELLRPRLTRRAEDRLRRSLLEDHTAVEKADAVGDVAREAHLVRGDDHRHAAGGELADHLEDLRDELRIERARHLVEQHQVRLHRERAHDRDALLLSAGQGVGIAARLVREPEALEQSRRAPRRLVLREPERESRRERDVAQHAHVREEVVRLEDDADASANTVHVDTPRGDLDALDNDAPCVDRLEQVHAAQQGRLPGAGRADQADDLVVGDLEVDASQHFERPEGLVQPFDEQGFAHVPTACRRRRSRRTSQSVNRASGTVKATNSSAAATYDV